MPRCNGCSADDDYDDFGHFIFKAHFENFLGFLDSRSKLKKLLMVFLMRPVWTFSVFSLQSYSRFRERSFFRRWGEVQQMRCRLILSISEHPIQQVIRKGVGLQSAFLWQTRTEGRILGSWMGICYRTLWEFYLGKHCLQAVCASFMWTATCSRLRSPELPLHHLQLKSYF